MSEHKTLNTQYSDGWENVKDGCMLCEMEKETEWYLETGEWVVAETLTGGPFIVYKRHQKELSEEEWEEMERIVGLVFDDFELNIIMAHCPNHFHAHILSASHE